MATKGKPIDESQIVKDGAVPKIVGEFNEWLKILNNIDSAFKTIAKNVSQIKPPTNAKEWSEMNKSMKVMEGNYKAQYDNLIKIERLEQARERTKQQQLRTQKLETQGTTRQLTEYQKLSRSLTGMRNRYKDLATMQSQGVKLSKQEVAEMSKLQKEVRSLDKTLKDIDGSVGQYQRNVGNYASAWSGVSKVFGGLFAGVTIGSVMGGAGSALVEFENNLASFRTIVSDLSDNEFSKFESAIKSVANSTKASSIDVAQSFENIAGLNAAFAETAEGLSAVSEAAITLSRASGDELGTTTESLVGIMNQFSMAATEADKTINVLAAGQAVGAAGITQLAESFKNVGSVASSSNVSLEQSVGLLEVLGKYNLMGAEAGTKLRGVILQLQKANIGYASGQFDINDALAEYNEKASKLTTEAEKNALAVKTFGAENITAGKILTSNIELINEFTQGVTGTTEAQKAASIQSQTLSAIWQELKNSLVNIVTSSGEAGSAMNGLKTVLKFLADNMETIVKVGGKLIMFWITYRTVMQSIKFIDHIKSLGGITNALKSQSTALVDATSKVGKFGTALKGLGLAGVIGLLVEIARAWYDIGSGAKYAREQEAAYERATNTGVQKAEAELARLKRIADYQKEIAKERGLQGKALADAIKQADNNYIKEIEDKIRRLEFSLKGAESRISNVSESGVVVGLGLGTDESIQAQESAEEIRQTIKRLRQELIEVSKVDPLGTGGVSGGAFGDDETKKVVDYTKAIRDLKVAMTEYEDAITTDFVKSVEELNNSTIDAIDKVIEEQENDKITQIKAEEYIQQLKDKNAYEFLKLQRKYTEDLYNFQREQELKALENRKLELEQRAQLSEMELGRSASQQRIAEIARDNKLREEVLNNRLLTDEQRHKKLEELEKEHQKRMNAILVEYLQASIQFQLEQIEKLTEVYGVSSKEVEEAGQRYLELEEQLQNALKKSADNIDSDKGLKGALQKVSGYFSNLMDAVMGKINETIDRAITGQNRLIDNSKSMINFLQQAAAAGNLAASESILAEEKKIEDAQKKIEKLEKNRQRAQLITGLLSSFSAKTAAGDKNALTSTLAESAILTAFLRTLPSFDVGADRLDSSGNGVDGKGGFHAIVHPDERILTADQNRKIGFDMKNEDVASVMYKYRNGILTGGSQPQIIVQDNTEKVLKEIKQGFSQINNWNMSVEQLFSTITVMVEKKKGNFTEKNIKNFKA